MEIFLLLLPSLVCFALLLPCGIIVNVSTINLLVAATFSHHLSANKTQDLGGFLRLSIDVSHHCNNQYYNNNMVYIYVYRIHIMKEYVSSYLYGSSHLWSKTGARYYSVSTRSQGKIFCSRRRQELNDQSAKTYTDDKALLYYEKAEALSVQ